MNGTDVARSFEALFTLTVKRALVTGGTSGIGLAIVQALAAAGAWVMTCSDRADDVANFSCVAHGRSIIA